MFRCALLCSVVPNATDDTRNLPQTHILRGTMKELEDVLDPRIFQRVHRSTIVNLRRVKSLRAHMNGEYFLTLEGAHELKMSRTYRDKVEYFLKGSPRG